MKSPDLSSAIVALHELTRAVSSAESMETIYEESLNCLSAVLGLKKASILLFDPDKILRFKAWRNLSETYRNAVEGHSPWTVDTLDALPICVSDWAQDQDLAKYADVFRAEGIRALAFVPLSNRRRTLGKFMLYCDEPHTFTDIEIQSAQTVASQIAFAIERKRADENSRRINDELERRVNERTSALRDSSRALQDEIRERLRTEQENRRLAQELQKANEETLRLALDAGNMGTWDWQIDTGKLVWTGNLEKIHGLEPGTFDGSFEMFQRIIHPDDIERVKSKIFEAIAKRSRYYAEFRILWPDRSIRWIAGAGSVLCDSSGKATRMIGVGFDLTDRKKSEERSQFLAETSGLLSASLDVNTILQNFVNRVIPQLADYCHVELRDEKGNMKTLAQAHAIPERLADVIRIRAKYSDQLNHAYHPHRVLESAKSILLTSITPAILKEIAADEEHMKDLVSLNLSSYMAIPLEARGKLIGALVLNYSDSGRRYDAADLQFFETLARHLALALENALLYQQTYEVNRAKDEFLAVLSHELRTPLTSILGWTRMIQSGALPRDQVSRALETIDRNVKAQTQLVNDLLDVSRIVANKLVLDFQTLDLTLVIEGVVDSFRPVAESRNMRLEANFGSERLLVRGDVSRLQQVFTNLISNAIKFSEEGSQVKVEVQNLGQAAEISVRDFGRGIPQDFIPYIFDRFRQADSTTKRTHGGLGLGLSITRHLLDLHNGQIIAKSDGENKGSEFIVTLPLMAAEKYSEASLPANMEPDALNGLKILAIEDNPDTLELLTTILDQAGAECRTAVSVSQGLEVFRTWLPDLIVGDIGLPNEDGYDLIRQLREMEKLMQRKATPAIALTAYSRAEDNAKIISSGYQIHLTKPIEPSELKKTVAFLAASRI